jgi:hypothetical protein
MPTNNKAQTIAGKVLTRASQHLKDVQHPMVRQHTETPLNILFIFQNVFVNSGYKAE